MPKKRICVQLVCKFFFLSSEIQREFTFRPSLPYALKSILMVVFMIYTSLVQIPVKVSTRFRFNVSSLFVIKLYNRFALILWCLRFGFRCSAISRIICSVCSGTRCSLSQVFPSLENHTTISLQKYTTLMQG